MQAAFIPYLYALITGASWAILFRKQFYESLAPGFFTQILIVLASVCLLHNFDTAVKIGLAADGIFLAAGIARGVYSMKKGQTFPISFWKGMLIFSVFYWIVWNINVGKRFSGYDEFQNWGMFLKESLRLNDLYTVSPLTIQHLDYVPAVTVFEVMWAKLCGRFIEADAYRAMQILCFSMILPIFKGILFESRKSISKQTPLDLVFKIILYVLAFGAVLLVPLIFRTDNGFRFYHTIYLDYIQGLLLFYCASLAFQDEKSFLYQILVLCVSLTLTVLSKQTAIAFLPMVVIYFGVRLLLRDLHHLDWKKALLYLLTILVPLGGWLLFRHYSDQYVHITDASAKLQTYGNFHLSDIPKILTGRDLTDVQITVRRSFLDALHQQDILLHGSYIPVMIVICLIVLLLAFLNRNKRIRKKVLLMALWIGVAAAAYAFVMLYLYEVAFDEQEGLKLASYTRYMNVLAVTGIYLILYLFFNTRAYRIGHKTIACAAMAVFCFAVSSRKDLMVEFENGTQAGDEQQADKYEKFADYINEYTEDSSRIMIVTRGTAPLLKITANYYCLPRYVTNVCPGPDLNDGYTVSSEWTVEEFVQNVGMYDYLYLNLLDQPFVDTYKTAFEDPSKIVSATLFKTEIVDGKIRLDQAFPQMTN